MRYTSEYKVDAAISTQDSLLCLRIFVENISKTSDAHSNLDFKCLSTEIFHTFDWRLVIDSMAIIEIFRFSTTTTTTTINILNLSHGLITLSSSRFM